MPNTFNVCRSIWTDPQFPNEPFTKREAWLWLVSEASWKDRVFRIGNHVVNLKRGQLAASIRGMAEIWRWEKTKVIRFLEVITQDKNIATDTAPGVTVITICNYDLYQNAPAVNAPPSAPETHQDRTTSAPIQNKDEIPEGIPEDFFPPSGEKPKRKKNDYPEDFEAWWRAYPTDQNMAKKEAFKEWKKLDATDREKALVAIAPFKAWISKQQNYRTLHAVRFLSQRRFDGFASSAPVKTFNGTETVRIAVHEEPEVFDRAMAWASQHLPGFHESGQEFLNIPKNVAENLRRV